MGKLNGCKVHHSTTQSRATNTALTFDTEDWDDDGYHAGANPTRLTAPVAGRYLIEAWGKTTAGAAQQYGMYFRRNGTTAEGTTDFRDSATTADKQFGISDIFNMAAGDYFEILVNHTGSITWAQAQATIQRVG